MTETIESATVVVDTYYHILQGGTESFDPAQLRAIVAPDLVFDGPIAGHRVGAEPFIKGVSGFVAAIRSIDFLERLYTGDRAATLYDAQLPGGTVRFAEFFQVNGSKIHSLRLLYDAVEYRARGGR